MIPLRYACPLAALLAICLLLDLVAAAPLPGVAWSKLEIWEGSAAAGVWLHPGALASRSSSLRTCGRDSGQRAEHLVMSGSLRLLLLWA